MKCFSSCIKKIGRMWAGCFTVVALGLLLGVNALAATGIKAANAGGRADAGLSIKNAVENTAEEIKSGVFSELEAFMDFQLLHPTRTDVKFNCNGQEALHLIVDSDPVKNISYVSAGSDFISQGYDAINIYEDEDWLYGRFTLAGSEFVKMPKKNVFSKFNSSVLAKVMERQLEYDDDFSFEPITYDEYKSILGTGNIFADFYNEYKTDFNTLGLKIMASAQENGEVYTLLNGKTAKGYEVEIKASDIAGIVDKYGEFYKNHNSAYLMFNKYESFFDTFFNEDDGYELEMLSSLFDGSIYNELADELRDEDFILLADVCVCDDKVVKVNVAADGDELTVVFPDGNYNMGIIDYVPEYGSSVHLEYDNSGSSFKLTADSLWFEDDDFWCTNDIVKMILNYNKADGNYTLNLSSHESHDYTNNYKKRYGEEKFANMLENGGITEDELKWENTYTVDVSGVYKITDDSFKFTADDIKYVSGDNVIDNYGFSCTIEALDEDVSKHCPTGIVLDVFTADETEFEAVKNKADMITETLEDLIYNFFESIF